MSSSFGFPASRQTKSRLVVVVGPPCSGKGTQCARLAARLGAIHISTGDAFRDEVARTSAFGLKIKPFMDAGSFVPDELVIQYLATRLGDSEVQRRGCLLDGFPRTAEQASALLSRVSVNKVVQLENVDPTALIQRAQGRRIDAATGQIFHVDFVQPPSSDESGNPLNLVQRLYDDDSAAFKVRLDIFNSQIGRVLDVFQSAGIPCVAVNAAKPLGEVTEQIIQQVDVDFLANRVPKVATPAVEYAESVERTFCCPITTDLMQDPVICPEGHSFERIAIEAWLEVNSTNPVTRNQLTKSMLTPNRALKESIEIFKRAQAATQAASDVSPEQRVSPGSNATCTMPSSADLEEMLDSQTGVIEHVTHSTAGTTDKEGEEDSTSDEDEPIEPSVTISLTDNISENGGQSTAVVRITPPENFGRAAVDVCCVVDISGSMASMATYEDATGRQVSDGLSVLDLVKHAVKTVMHTLSEEDRLSIVAFDGRARTALPLTIMSARGRAEATTALEALVPQGSTNIWAGVLAGMEALRGETASAGSNDNMVDGARGKAVLLLTDGQPNISPPRGCVAEMRDFLDTHPDFSFQLNTFGFGYSLDSNLLLELAREGNGTYAFIPDAVIVGTTFVNSIANVLSTFAQNATLSLSVANGAAFGPMSWVNPSGKAQAHSQEVAAGSSTKLLLPGGLNVSEESWGLSVALGPLQVGQPRSIAVPIILPPFEASTGGAAQPTYLHAVVNYPTVLCGGSTGEEGRVAVEGSRRDASDIAVVDALRAKVISIGKHAVVIASDENRKSGSRRRGRTSGNTAGGQKAEILVSKLAQELRAKLADWESPSAARSPRAIAINETKGADADATPPPESKAVRQLRALLTDVEGRMSKALQGTSRFHRWGRHYLRALLRAHEVQLCTNFMDPGLQMYGGSLFAQLRDRGDKIFLELPPPQPMVTADSSGLHAQRGRQARVKNRTTTSSAARAAAPASPPVKVPNMQTYYAGSGGGCFGPMSTVLVQCANGRRQRTHVRDVRPGDFVAVSGDSQSTSADIDQADDARKTVKAHTDDIESTPCRKHRKPVFARVECTVHIARDPETQPPLVSVGGAGLHITKRHPVFVAGRWQQAGAVARSKSVTSTTNTDVNDDRLVTDCVYNFVLEEGAGPLIVGGVPCATWGHGMTGPGIGHAFYGNRENVMATLRTLPGWERRKMVRVTGSLRDSRTDAVVGVY